MVAVSPVSLLLRGITVLSALLLLACSWERPPPPAPVARPVSGSTAPVMPVVRGRLPQAQILVTGAALTGFDRQNYPSPLSDSQRELFRATGTAFAPYHLCDVVPGRRPFYCASGAAVEGYWLNAGQYVVYLPSHRQALLRGSGTRRWR